MLQQLPMTPLSQLVTLTQQCRLAHYSWSRTTLFVLGRFLLKMPMVGPLLLAAAPRCWARALNCYVKCKPSVGDQAVELLPPRRIVATESEMKLLELKQALTGRAADDYRNGFVAPAYRLIQL